jgi:NH3-dependent NAD+ synthetase
MLEAVHAVACLAVNPGVSGGIDSGLALWVRTLGLGEEGAEWLFRGVGGRSYTQFLSSACCRPSTFVRAFMGVFGAVIKTKLPKDISVSAR